MKPTSHLPRIDNMPLRLVLLTCLVSVVLQTGCMHRRILVRSNPEGALLTIDHQPIGHTPVAVPFTYYGTREIELEKDGYESISVKKRFSPPWYQIPPLDFVSDNLWPREIHDDRLLDFQMTPMSTVNETNLKSRANQLRGNTMQGMIPMPLAEGAKQETQRR